MDNKKLLQAKSIIEKYFTQNDLVKFDDSGTPVGYCALGAIAKAHELDMDKAILNYGIIPEEDVVALACAMDEGWVTEIIEQADESNRVEGRHRYKPDVAEVVYSFNDAHSKEEVIAKFSEACKNYKKYEAVIKKYKKAVAFANEKPAVGV